MTGSQLSAAATAMPISYFLFPGIRASTAGVYARHRFIIGLVSAITEFKPYSIPREISRAQGNRMLGFVDSGADIGPALGLQLD